MKKILVGVLCFLVVIICIAIYHLAPQIEIATGFAAKKACSYHFISGRSIESVQQIDMEMAPLNLIDLSLDKSQGTVSASLFGFKKKKAIYKPGLGCTLLHGEDNYHIGRTRQNTARRTTSSDLPLSSQTQISEEILNEAVDLAMDTSGKWDKKTTSLLIVHQDSIVRETYSEGFDRETEILGWSMTKSVCNLLIGMLIQDGKLSLDQKNLYPAWENDARKNITIAQLLHMTSGLEWTEEYEVVCDITQGLYKEEDFLSFARSKPLESPSGTVWEYASGTTNILSGLIKRQFESYQDYLSFPEQRLFDKLGMESAYMETDEAGNYIMSSYLFAKARDWAKLGLLYLHKGNWQGEQLIDESYINWSLQPSIEPTYGAQIWLNTNKELFPSLPADTYKFSGYEGQYVVVVPSRDLVVVRTGLSKGPPFDIDQVMAKILESIRF